MEDARRAANTVSAHRAVLASEKVSGRAKAVLWVSVVATAVLYLVPFGYWLNYPFWMLSTLFHELGHGASALLMGASFEAFTIWPNGSGVANWSGTDVSSTARAMIAAGGLVGPAIVATFAFIAARRSFLARLFFLTLAAGLLGAEILVVRNTFGLVFIGATIACFAWLALRSSANTVRFGLVFIAVQLSLSVFSRGDYLFTETAHTSQGVMPSDVANISSALFGPYWLWGAVCGGASVLALVVGLRFFLGKKTLKDTKQV